MSPAPPTADVAVVGLGVVGAACARYLARAGRRVVAIDPRPPGSEASGAAFGQIAPRVEPSRPRALLPLWRASHALFPDLIASLAEETGERVDYNRRGRISLAFNDADLTALETTLAEQRAADVPGEWLDAATIRAREPALDPAVRAGVWWPQHHSVDNAHLTRALAAAAERAGAHLRGGRRVVGLAREPDRVVGVRLDDGSVLRAATVLVAAGAWSGALDPAHPMPVRPVRGQGIAFQLPPGTLTHIVSTPTTLIIHRASGRTMIGTTNEEVGFERAVTADAVLRFVAEGVRVVPALAGARFLDAWCGFRPVMPDDLPVLGPDPRHGGLLWATGHLGVGIALAPVTATLISDLLDGRAPAFDLAPFSPTRFLPP